VHCGQTVGCIKMKLGMEARPRPWPHCVRSGPSSPSPQKRRRPPIFGPCLLWPKGWMDQDATWHGGRSRPRPQCARGGPSSPSPKKGHSPQFLAHVYCGQTAGWFKMPLSVDVGLSPGHTVLYGDPAPPPPKGHSPHPIFGPHLLWPDGWMDQDATWLGR